MKINKDPTFEEVIEMASKLKPISFVLAIQYEDHLGEGAMVHLSGNTMHMAYLNKLIDLNVNKHLIAGESENQFLRGKKK